MTGEDPGALLPEALLLAGAVLTLLVGMFSPRNRQHRALLTALGFCAGSIAAAIAAAGMHRLVYEDSYAIDLATTGGRIIVPGAAALVMLLARDRIAGMVRETEFYVLVLLASLGTIVLAGTSDLILLAVGYLLASIPLYALVGWARDPGGAEATLKTYLLGALMSILMFTGIATLAATTGGSTTYAAIASGAARAPQMALAFGLVAVLAALLYKAGAAPAHYWLPDAVSGATVPAAAFATTIPKIGALIAAYRLFAVIRDDAVHWRVLIAVLAAASMTLGNLAAYRQDDAKRLLAYSTISQVGYLLMAVAVAETTSNALPALMLYLAAYAVTNIGAFAVLAALPNRRTLDDWRGTGRDHPWLVTALGICLLGLVGIPPTAGFLGKLTVFTATWNAGYAWLVAVAAVNTIASLYYYLRWLAPAVLRAATTSEHADMSTDADATHALRLPTVIAYVCGIAALAVGASGVILFGGATTLAVR